MATPTLRRIQIGLFALTALAGFSALYVGFIGPRLAEKDLFQLGVGDYTLTTTTGEPFTQDTLRGQPSGVFFGFTHCPDVCPTTLGDIATWQEEMGPSADEIRYYFITVDPERDTPELLSDYVSWAPNVVGVTGTRAELDKALDAFRIYARKVPLEGDDYTMDHGSYVMLFDRKGRFFEPIGYQEDFPRVIDKLGRLLAE